MAFFLELFNANKSTPFVEWVDRAATRIMQPFRGIFPPVEGESGSVFDPALLFGSSVLAPRSRCRHSSGGSTEIAAWRAEEYGRRDRIVSPGDGSSGPASRSRDLEARCRRRPRPLARRDAFGGGASARERRARLRSPNEDAPHPARPDIGRAPRSVGIGVCGGDAGPGPGGVAEPHRIADHASDSGPAHRLDRRGEWRTRRKRGDHEADRQRG
jgi:hypothetical protein